MSQLQVGVQAVVGHVPAVGGRVPTVGGCVPAVGGRVPAVGGRVPAVGGRVPAVGGRVPVSQLWVGVSCHLYRLHHTPTPTQRGGGMEGGRRLREDVLRLQEEREEQELEVQRKVGLHVYPSGCAAVHQSSSIHTQATLERLMLQSRQREIELRSRTGSRRRKKRLTGGRGERRPVTYGGDRLFSRERRAEEPPEVSGRCDRERRVGVRRREVNSLCKS